MNDKPDEGDRTQRRAVETDGSILGHPDSESIHAGAAGSSQVVPGDVAPDDVVSGDGGTSDVEDAAAHNADMPRSARRKKSARSGFLQWLKELPLLLAIAFVIAILLKTFIIQPYWIPSASMEHTLHGCPGCVGDRILVNKMSYWFGDPEPGDVVVFKAPNSWEPETTYQQPSNVVGEAWLWLKQAIGAAPPPEKDLVKRVIAVGGQTVAGDAAGDIFVNGKKLNEPYVFIDPGATGYPKKFGPITVPKGRMFMMGDHRNDSADSRYHLGDPYQGTISTTNVIGRAFAIVWPFGRANWLSNPGVEPSATGPPIVPLSAEGVLLPISILWLRRRSRLRIAVGNRRS